MIVCLLRAVMLLIPIGQAFGVTRAAFDLGSGTFKVLVAAVEGDVIECKFSRIIPLGLGYDLASSADNRFSEKNWQAALNALGQLAADAKAHGATQFAGVATAAFREAKNGAELLQFLKDESKIDLQIISQEKEGILGFETTMALFPEFSKNQTIAFDMGGSSFQLVACDDKGYSVYHGSLGISKLVKLFFEEIRKIPYARGMSYDPITSEEIQVLIETIKRELNFPQWLKEKPKQEGVRFVFCDDNISEIQKRTGKIDCVSRNELEQALSNVLTCELDEPRIRLVLAACYALLYSIMSHLDIDHCEIREVTFGITAGVAKENIFWKN